jgi:predicted RNA-binding protein (virulence factor B family)
MMKIGIWNTLTVLRDTQYGLFLGDDAGNDVLLPNKYCPRSAKVGDQLDVFIYRDSEERLVATNLQPLIKLNTYAYLQVRHISTVGAFLDWGLEKDLLSPYREQEPRMEVGQRYMVFMYLDELTGRLVATNRIRRFLHNEELDVEEGQEVLIQIWEETEIGFRAIVNNRFSGMLYRSELFQPLHIGDRVKGYVKAIRPDNKLDLTLQKQGFQHVEDQTEELLAKLTAAGGKMPIGDKSTPEEILRLLHISKKTFKKAAGILMKKGLVQIDDHSIHLLKNAHKGKS